MVDASTQVGAAWLVTCYTEVDGARLLPLSDALDTLLALGETSGMADDSDDAHQSEKSQLQDYIISSQSTHTLPPVGIGVGAGNLLHKANCILHQLRLELPSWQAVKNFGKTVVSFTTDLGVEAGLHTLSSSVDLDAFVPGFQNLYQSEGDGVAEADDAEDVPMNDAEVAEDNCSNHCMGDNFRDGEEAPPEAAVEGVALAPDEDMELHLGSDASAGIDSATDDCLLFSSALLVPGLMHVLHNAVRDVTKVLESYDWFFQAFSVFCNFCKHKPNRDRIVGQCFAKPPASWAAESILAFSPDITCDTRWGYLISTCEATLEIESALRTWWDPAKVDVPAQRRLQGDPEGDPSEFVRSAAHWAYCKMLCAANMIVADIDHWVWSCNCHPRKDSGLEHGASWGRRSRAFRQQAAAAGTTWSTCPMRGRHIGEVACGHVDTLIERHSNIYTTEVLMFTQGLSAAARNRILRDFELAHKHISYVIRLKLGMFVNNPFRMLALAHPNPEIARRHCQLAFADAEEEARSREPGQDAHALVDALVFRPGCKLKKFTCSPVLTHL